MAAPPVATDKTLESTTKSVVDANASVEAAAQGTTAAVKTGVDATKKVVEQVGNVSGALGNVATTIADSNKSLITAAGKTTASVEKVTSGIEQTATQTKDAIEGLGKKITAPVVNITPPVSTAGAGLKDISKQLMKAVGKLAFDKTLGKLPNSIKSIGSTIGGLVTNPTKTLANMGESVLGKLNSWGGLGDIGSTITFADTPPAKEGGEGGEKDEEKSQLAETSNGLLGQLVEAFWSVRDIQANMLNLMVDDSADAAEAAKEAARKGLLAGKPDPNSKVEEAKAGGFFSRMGKAVMNPMKALGSGMSKIGKGIQGILTGIARGLMAFANPLVLVGVTFLSLSLPILAAGLAAAFKVFDMIAGQGAALDFLTGIITSLGEAIGIILQKVLEGLGAFVKASGPFLLDFFKGIAIVIEALTPIISLLVPIVDLLMNALTAILTNESFNKTLQVIVEKVGDIVLAVIDLAAKMMPVLEVLFTSIEGIVETLGKVIIAVINALMLPIKTIGDVIIAVVENIGAIFTSIGNGISGIIDSIGGVIQVVGDVIVAVIDAIGDAVVKVIDGIVSGIERLGALDGGNMLVVAAALAGLAGGLVLFSVGAAVAGAIMPSAKTIEGFANAIDTFGNIDGANLPIVGKGMEAIGIGLAAFGVGGAIASLLTPGEGGLDSVATSVKKFGDIDAANFAAVGTGMNLIGEGLKAFGIGGFIANLLNSPEGLVNVAESVAKFGAIDATNFNMVGTGIQKIGEGLSSFAGGGFLSSLSEGFGSLIGASDPVEKFQKFAKIGPGLDVAAEGIKGLALAMKDFEATVKGLDLARVDEVAEGLAKIRDAQDPGALSKIGGIVGSFFGGGDKKEEGDGGQTIPAMIAQTNLLLEQGFITGPSGLFGSPGIGTSAFLMSRQQQKQITTAESQLKTAEETKKEIKSPVKVNPRTGRPMPVKEIKSPVLTEIKIPEPEKFVYKPMKLATPDVAEFGGGTAVSVGDPRFKTPRQRREERDARRAKRLEVSEQKEQEYEWVGTGRTRRYVKKVEPLDTTAVTPTYQAGQVPPGQALMAGQMESNALATESSVSPSITDASSSTIVNNSNQSVMMPESDPNPHNMDFHPEGRLFPRV